jgi:O-methyltransferase involved in polyketide biosynthesis
MSWHDAQIVTALDDGIEQVAVVGAGYDSRAWRFRRAGVQFFELERVARAGSGEKLKLLVDRAQAAELVETSGWDVTEETSMREAARALVPRESGLPVEAINEHKTLVAGLRS